MKPPQLPLFRRFDRLAARRVRQVLLLVQQEDTILAFRSRGNTLTPLPSLSESTLQPDEPVDEIRLCLAASKVFFRVWTFPFRSRTKIQQSLRLLMGSELPFEPDTLEHALLIQPGDKKNPETVVLSASVHKAHVRGLLETLRGYGLEPDTITVDPFPFIGCLSSSGTRKEPVQGGQVHCLLRETHTILVYMNGRTAQTIHIVPTGWNALCPCNTTPVGVEHDAASRSDANTKNSFAASVRVDGFRTALERKGCSFDVQQASAVFVALHDEALRLFQQYGEDATPEICLHCELFTDARTASLFSETRCADVFTQGGIRLSLPFAEPEAALLRCEKMPAVFPAPAKKRDTSFLGGQWQWKAGIACALVLGSVLLALLAEGSFFDRTTTMLETESVSLFQTTFPELAGRKFGAVQMESILRQRVQARTTTQTETQSVSVVRFLSAMHLTLDPSFSVRFNTFRLSRNVASLSGITDEYETVNRIRDTLAQLTEVKSVRLVNAGAGVGRSGTNVADPKRPSTNAALNIVFELEIVLQ